MSARPHGEIRQSQLVGTFGPGSMVDLPDYSVLIGGLDFWQPSGEPGEKVREPRLAQKLARVLQVPSIDLIQPPPPYDEQQGMPRGVLAFRFPQWFISQDQEDGARPGVRSRLLVHRLRLTKGRFTDGGKKRRSVVPIRFVRACKAGHIGDIDWHAFAHNGPSDCARLQRQLFLDERGTSGDLTEVWIRCECQMERSLAQASRLENRALGLCDGARPWLGLQQTRESCTEPNRLLIRSASNAYFPQLMSVISLPDRDETASKAVMSVWTDLEYLEESDEVRMVRRKPAVKAALGLLTDAEVWAAIQARKGQGTQPDKSVKHAELETLLAVEKEFGTDQPEGVFYARALPRSEWDQDWMRPFERVVLVHRLREVVAQVGFTRFESAGPDTEGELDMGVKRAALAREPQWLPTVENRGEGVFLQFRTKEIEAWLGRPAVKKRAEDLMRGFQAWQKEHSASGLKFAGLPYVLLHSFAHLLINAISLRCGYPASSIRERVYALPTAGYGVLLHTGTSDAEGTLGGLVQEGRRIHEAVFEALRQGELCSNDPVCAQHSPVRTYEHRLLHGAACHGCLLISETSCELRNEFLDRALVVPTVEGLGAEFFTEIIQGEPGSARAQAV